MCFAGQSVSHTVTIANTGNAKLRTVSISTTLSTQRTPQPGALSAYSCILTPGVTTHNLPTELPKGGTLACTATYTFISVEQIEAGDLTFTATVSAALVTPDISLTNTVAVPSVPKFSMTLDAQACAAAAPSPENYAGVCLLLRFMKTFLPAFI